MEVRLHHFGNTYWCHGFGNMLTFPPFRRQGYGGQVLQAATQYIKASPVDVAALFCDPTLEKFYSACGWQRADSPTHLGQPDRYQEYAPLRMMLFLSEKGRANQKDFETQPMYVAWPW
jgi:hypothetical protein